MILAGGLDRGVILGPRPIYGVVAPLLIGVGLGWLPGGHWGRLGIFRKKSFWHT